MELELVIRGAQVYDGTGGPARSVEVGISQGRIAALGQGLSGREVFDARGLAAAPGFIDTHSHSDLRVLVEPHLEPKLRQGITLELFGQDGISVAPVGEDQVPNRRRQLSGLLSDPDVSWAWRSVGDYLDELSRVRPAVDVAYLVPHGPVREAVVGLDNRRPTAAELAAMRALLAKGLDEGAFGLSTGLIYPPCCYAELDELVELGKELAPRARPFVVHLRSESDRLLEAMEEMFEVGRRSGAPIHLSHFKIAGRNNFAKLERVLDAVDAAVLGGVKVTADQYPYVAGSTMLGAILPPWVHDGGPERAVARLGDPAARARIRDELLEPGDVDWDNFWKWSGPEGIVVADVPSGRRPELLGKTLAQGAQRVGADPIEFALDLLRDERLGVAMVSFSQSEAVVERLLRSPFVNACTDGLLGGRPHPRAFGTCPRILGRYARDQKALSLEEAIRKLSGLAADAFGFRDHGYLEVGRRANLVLFDPPRVEDLATFEQPQQFPRGIPHVMVGGRFVVRDGTLTGERPGQVVRWRGAR